MATRRLYYDDAFETEFTARVTSCEPALIPLGKSSWIEPPSILRPAASRTISASWVMPT